MQIYTEYLAPIAKSFEIIMLGEDLRIRIQTGENFNACIGKKAERVRLDNMTKLTSELRNCVDGIASNHGIYKDLSPDNSRTLVTFLNGLINKHEPMCDAVASDLGVVAKEKKRQTY